jgi:hypothetical protein
VGGPAVTMNPRLFENFADTDGQVNALPHHNPDATFTSRGCIRKCSFCAVPIIEGCLIELPDREWEPKRIICDNNLLATSPAHFDHVIDRLLSSGIKKVDFNQGLDARILTAHHAERLAELPGAIIRLAWDNTKTEPLFRQAFELLISAGIRPARIFVYVLLGYHDTPQDALYRLETVRTLGALPNPMRYQPLNAIKRNEYVDHNWTKKELADFMRYWARQNWLKNVPFSEYDPVKRHVQHSLAGAIPDWTLDRRARGLLRRNGG